MKTIRSRLRLLATALLAAALSLTLLAPAEAKKRNSYPDEIALPNGFRPEGITIGKRPIAYIGSLADGDIYRRRPAHRQGQGRRSRRRHSIGGTEDRPTTAARSMSPAAQKAPPRSSTCGAEKRRLSS